MTYEWECDISKADEYFAPVVRDIARIKDAYERVGNIWEKYIALLFCYIQIEIYWRYQNEDFVSGA